MCLDVWRNSKLRTANKDIIVYKWLIRTLGMKEPVNTGDSFTAIIFGEKCEGKIMVEEGKVYFCNNHPKLHGRSPKNKLGYINAWVFDNKVSNIFINKKPLELDNLALHTPYLHCPVFIGVTYESKLEKDGKIVHVGLHSFEKENDARLDISYGAASPVLVQCIIPKGANYYKGRFGDAVSYASDKLEYIKIL